MILPNFIIAGAMPAGTSFLSSALKGHGDVYLPEKQRPEPNFFHYTWKYEKGIEWYSKSLFSEVRNEKAIGERSSLLLTSNKAISRIRAHLNDVKLIFCLRNPIERAWANYRYTVLEGLEQYSFEQAIMNEETRKQSATGIWKEVLPHAYIERSHYSTQLKNFINAFGKENILLVCSEELSAEPHRKLLDICKFLEIDHNFSFQLPPNFSSPSVIDPALQKNLREYFGDRYPDISEHIRKNLSFDNFIQNKKDEEKIGQLRSNLKPEKEKMSTSNRSFLTDLLSEEISQIRKIVDFSTDHWI